MPDEEIIIRPSTFKLFLDTGQLSVAVSILILVLIIVCFVLGLRGQIVGGSGKRYPTLLLVLAAVTYLANEMMISATRALLFNMQIYGSIDPASHAMDLAILETQRMLYSGLALLAVLGAGILLVFPRKESP